VVNIAHFSKQATAKFNFRQRLKQPSRVGVCKWELNFGLALIFALHRSRETSVAPRIARLLIKCS
jgi:hypothetical protein